MSRAGGGGGIDDLRLTFEILHNVKEVVIYVALRLKADLDLVEVGERIAHIQWTIAATLAPGGGRRRVMARRVRAGQERLLTAGIVGRVVRGR